MSKSQEQRMNELAEALGPKTSPNPIYDENYMPRQYFKSGYQAAMKEAEVLVEALENYAHELSTFDGTKANRAMEALKKFKGE